MIPILYPKGAKKADANSNGLGFLAECIKCEVTEERNGVYEASLQYPMSGALFAKIEEGCIIKIQANDGGTPQLFRIYNTDRRRRYIFGRAYIIRAERPADRGAFFGREYGTDGDAYGVFAVSAGS